MLQISQYKRLSVLIRRTTDNFRLPRHAPVIVGKRQQSFPQAH